MLTTKGTSELTLGVFAFGVRAVEALLNGVHSGKDGGTFAANGCKVVVPHVGGVAEGIPARSRWVVLGVALVEGLAEVGERPTAVLQHVVMEDHNLVDLVTGGDVRAVVGGILVLGGYNTLHHPAHTGLVEGVDGVSENNNHHSDEGQNDFRHLLHLFEDKMNGASVKNLRKGCITMLLCSEWRDAAHRP